MLSSTPTLNLLRVSDNHNHGPRSTTMASTAVSKLSRSLRSSFNTNANTNNHDIDNDDDDDSGKHNPRKQQQQQQSQMRDMQCDDHHPNPAFSEEDDDEFHLHIPSVLLGQTGETLALMDQDVLAECLQPVMQSLRQLDAESLLNLRRVENGARLCDG